MISEKELDNAIKNMLRRHILEDWMFVRNASNNQKTMYISKEGFDWLKEVWLLFGFGYFIFRKTNQTERTRIKFKP